jgi:pantothenate kinase
VRVEQEDEVACAVEGCNFLLRKIPDEAFTYFTDDSPPYKFQVCVCP